MWNKNYLTISMMGILLGSLTACSSQSAISTQSAPTITPDQWQNEQVQVKVEGTPDWMAYFQAPDLIHYTELALNNNRLLKAQEKQVLITRQALLQSEATDWPEITLSASQSRNKRPLFDDATYENNADISLQASYELDIWGRLSDEQQRANLSYLSAKAEYFYQREQLAANISKAWFNLSTAEQLLALYQQRAKNLGKDFDIINSSYQLGLSGALDVYLTQNNLSSEQARFASQQQVVIEAKRDLELLIGQYPKASVANNEPLPLITAELSTSLPSEMISNRFDLNASWYQLLAGDASLAIAHKNRFPRIALTASTGDSSDQLDDLLSGNSLAWSLIGNISTPIFNAGRLEALEEQAKLAVEQQEQQYLEDVHQAFADVENAISNHHALLEQYQYIVSARDNAKAAEELSFNQYLKGLVEYTTVLESQRRAFDSQTSLVQLKNQLIQNRIDLHLAMGGKFSEINPSISATEPKLTQQIQQPQRPIKPTQNQLNQSQLKSE